MPRERSISIGALRFVEEFYDALSSYFQLLRRRRRLSSLVRALLFQLNRITETIDGILQEMDRWLPRRSLWDIGAMFEVLEDVVNVLNQMQNLNTIPEAAVVPFRGMSLAVLYELSRSFHQIIRRGGLARQRISRYANLVSSVGNYLEFEVNDDVSNPAEQFSIIYHYLQCLTDELNTDSEDGGTSTATGGLSEECKKKNTLLYSYKKNQRETQEEDATDPCTICQYDLDEGDRARRLPCLHVFHATCVDQWFKDSKICPVCRLNVQEEFSLQLTEEAV